MGEDRHIGYVVGTGKECAQTRLINTLAEPRDLEIAERMSFELGKRKGGNVEEAGQELPNTQV